MMALAAGYNIFFSLTAICIGL
uniref:VUT family protein n=2 Tax=Bursaphelenchus xylophilus TaxID=6326 RepID=A0A1I7SJ29_BURXY